MSDERLWTVKDVAAFLTVTPKTVRYWQTQCHLPFLKIGGTIRFLPEEVRQWATKPDQDKPVEEARIGSSGAVARAERANYVLPRHAKASNLTRRTSPPGVAEFDLRANSPSNRPGSGVRVVAEHRP